MKALTTTYKISSQSRRIDEIDGEAICILPILCYRIPDTLSQYVQSELLPPIHIQSSQILSRNTSLADDAEVRVPANELHLLDLRSSTWCLLD